MDENKKKILKNLELLFQLYPDWRFGQSVINISYWAKGPEKNAAWDVEDSDFLKSLENHLEKRNIKNKSN